MSDDNEASSIFELLLGDDEGELEIPIDSCNRVIVISTEFGEVFDKVDKGLTGMEKDSSEPVTIKLKSFGGCPYDAMAILGRMKSSPLHIIVEGYGAVMSAATIILAGGDTRRLSEYASFMWHHGTQDLGIQDTARIQDEATAIIERDKHWSACMARFSTARRASANFWYKAGEKDTYFTPKELLKLGVIDEII